MTLTLEHGMSPSGCKLRRWRVDGCLGTEAGRRGAGKPVDETEVQFQAEPAKRGRSIEAKLDAQR